MASRSSLAAMGSRPRSLLAALVRPTFGRGRAVRGTGGLGPGDVLSKGASGVPDTAAPDVAAHRHVRRLFRETVATDAQVPENNYPVKRCEKASKRRGERSDLGRLRRTS